MRLPFLPVASGRVEVPHRALGLDQFQWTHPAGHVHVRATLMIDQGSRVALVQVHEDKPTKARLGNTSAEEVHNTLTGTWFKYYGKPEAARTDPDGCFNALSLRSWLASKGVAWEPEPAGAHHRLGVTERYVGVLKVMASKVTRRLPDDTSPQEIFVMCTTAHNDLHRTKGASPWQLLLGRVPRGLRVTGPEDQTPSELAAQALEPEDVLRRQLELKTAACQEYIARELSEQSARAALARARTTRNWNSSGRVWYWREITRHREAGASHKAPVSARGIGAKQGRFLGPATVLLQERGVELGHTRRRKVVWLANGQQILRVATHHLKHLTIAEQALQDVTDSEAKSFQDLVQGLRRGGGTMISWSKETQRTTTTKTTTSTDLADACGASNRRSSCRRNSSKAAAAAAAATADHLSSHSRSNHLSSHGRSNHRSSSRSRPPCRHLCVKERAWLKHLQRTCHLCVKEIAWLKHPHGTRGVVTRKVTSRCCNLWNRMRIWGTYRMSLSACRDRRERPRAASRPCLRTLLPVCRLQTICARLCRHRLLQKARRKPVSQAKRNERPRINLPAQRLYGTGCLTKKQLRLFSFLGLKIGRTRLRACLRPSLRKGHRK